MNRYEPSRYGRPRGREEDHDPGERHGSRDFSRRDEGPYGTSHWGKDYANARRLNENLQRHGTAPKGYVRADERICEEISEALMCTHYIDSSEVTVSVREGKVILEGSVPDRRMKHAIEDIADRCPGVQDVDNRLRVNREASRGGSGPNN